VLNIGVLAPYTGDNAIQGARTIQYVGASGALIFNQHHSAGRAFAYENYDPTARSMKSIVVIAGMALNG